MFDESLEEAWLRKYGAAPPNGSPELGRLLTHRSVRDFSSEPVPEETVAGLIAAAQSASTSSNLQLWSVISVQDSARRTEAAKLCGDQKQIHDAAWFFAFVVDHARLRSFAAEEPDALGSNEFFTMAVVDAAIAAERMVCAAESLGLGVCYIGALRNHPAEMAEFLNLPAGTFGVFGLALGWPAEDCTAAMKPRLGQEVIWHRESYNHEQDPTDYNQRMAAFYEEQHMRASVTWSMRSGRRATKPKLGGRADLKPFLESQGMDLE
jgi:nitroreductase